MSRKKMITDNDNLAIYTKWKLGLNNNNTKYYEENY